MKALVYTGPQCLAYRDEPDPVPAADEVVIEVEAVGICGSDMHAWHGHDARRVPPLILGHELCGTVVAGAGVGRRVTVNPLVTCGHCGYCITGRDNLCENRTMVGMTRPGAFAERMAIPARSVVDLPAGLAVEHAALTEPAATGLHALRLAERALARPLAEADVLVIGAGAVGLLAALLLHGRGIRRLHVAETNPLRRASASRCGDFVVYDPRAEARPGNAAVDLVIDAVGAAATRAAAMAAVRPGGVVMQIGLLEAMSEIDMRKLTLSEVSMIGTYTYTMADLRATVRAIAEGAYGSLDWIETRALADGAHAFADIDAGRAAAAKILLVPPAGRAPRPALART
jgi:2-desacetyl-2-hydroxyethyl bacteriochlorophyllide A dehydrogenase